MEAIKQIAVIDPSGQPGTIPETDVPNAMGQGFKLDTPAMQAARTEQAKYSTVPEELKTAAEGAASGATLGLSRELENATGISTPQAQSARARVNPGISGVSEVAGSVAGLLGSEEALAPLSLATKASKGAAKMAEGILGRVGSEAVGSAVMAQSRPG